MPPILTVVVAMSTLKTTLFSGKRQVGVYKTRKRKKGTGEYAKKEAYGWTPKAINNGREDKLG